MKAEGIENRWSRHAAMQQATIDWVDAMNAAGIQIGVFAPAGHRSPTVTCVTLPDATTGPEVVAAMRERGWVIGGGYSRLKESTIRIGHMGDHRLEDLNELLSTLGEVLQ
jgi:aspartate aminotransferase-like enzyme